jgi:hypothetical protein
VPGATPELRVHLDRNRFRGGQERLVKQRSVQLMAEYPPSPAGAVPDFEAEFGAPPLAAAALRALAVDPDDSRYADSDEVGFGPAAIPAAGVDWRLRFRDNGGDFADFDPAAMEELYLIVGYSVQPAAP